MKTLIMQIEVDDFEQQQLLYDVLQEMIEERSLVGYFTLVDDGEPVEDLPDYMAFEINKLIPEIVKLEKCRASYKHRNSK